MDLFKQIEHIETEHGINRNQVLTLFELAKQSKEKIVEIGSFRGRSTSILSLGSKEGNKFPVYAIDPFTAHGQRDENIQKFERNLKKAKARDLVKTIPLKSQNVEVKEIGLLFIDGDHKYKGVKRDYKKFEPEVLEEGWIAIHDFHLSGVKKVFDELIYPELSKGKKSRFQNFKLVDNLMVFQKR